MNAVVPSSRRVTRERESTEQELEFELPAPAHLTRGRVLLWAGLGVFVAATAFLSAYVPRHRSQSMLEHAAAQRSQRLTRVVTVKPQLVESGHRLTLTGSVAPLEEATIYARASGYVQRWLVDIGTEVRAGALLAEIDTPEIDRELMQARATLAQAEAKRVQARAALDLSRTTLTRMQKLEHAGVASRQELDEAVTRSQLDDAGVKLADADISAQRANIQRLLELKSFARVTAPFAGTITSREVARGTLVSAGTATPLYHLAATTTVRLLVQVPQLYASSVSVDQKATVRIREFPNIQFEGKVTRTSGALDPESRTLTTEVHLPNPEHKLLSGTFAEVDLDLNAPYRVFEIPSTALMNDAAGLRVALVDGGNQLRLQRIQIERDLGQTVRVSNGIGAEDRVVRVANAELAEGQRVEVAP